MERFFIPLMALCIILTGCNKDSSDIDNSSYAQVSVYALVPDVPELNFFLNGSNIAAGVPYNSYTLYNRVTPGLVTFSGQSYSRSITVDTSFAVAQNNYYSLFLTGSSTTVKPVVLHDSFPSPQSGFCGLRFLIFSPGVSGIDLHLVKDSVNNITGWTKRSYSDNLTADSINTFKKFAQGTYSFYAINQANSMDTIAKLGSKTFSDSANYTLLLTGELTQNDTALLLGSRLH